MHNFSIMHDTIYNQQILDYVRYVNVSSFNGSLADLSIKVFKMYLFKIVF